MNKKLGLLLATVMATLLILAACGNTSNKEEGISKEEDTSKKQESTEESVRVIEHVLGETEIKGKPQKIVTLYQGATDTIVQFGVKPVGAVESWAEAPIYEYIREEVGDVTIVGQETQPNLEEIATLQPDLIIATQVRHEEIYAQLSQIAPTVVSTTLYDIRETTELLGKALEEEEKAKELMTAWDARIAEFKEKMTEKGDFPLSVAVTNYRADHARIYVEGFAGSILTELGFTEPKNLVGQNLEIVKLTDKESISSMNADVIFEFMEDDAAVKSTHEEWTKHPLYANLDAVKNNQVFTVNEIVWNLGGGLTAANLMLDELYAYLELEQ
ncbi:iron-siderophore ABC transporter substrate-binding protein [Metasolibacillus meyeri]|uniref:Iron-siderophore ABC transporter substrate-binding protein n=1 Tax=Metasolibacillus meyeri TaxID=1071052 RepID=A0AAW9NRE2_9BACL|nr:iron-siderophore ABC transporter substrate-binding protein [Metasolibacillus meyeri]MEC1178498.1 iron-siderophore ABC transporter substrate-binding protein [Metasolibacillus meyeri]